MNKIGLIFFCYPIPGIPREAPAAAPGLRVIVAFARFIVSSSALTSPSMSEAPDRFNLVRWGLAGSSTLTIELNKSIRDLGVWK